MEKPVRKAAVLLLALALAPQAACGKGALEARRAPLRVWAVGPDASAEASVPAFEAALAACRKADPLRRIDAEAFPAAGYEARLAAALAAGAAPDVFAFFGGVRLRSLAADGRLLALDPYLDDAFRTGLLPGMTEDLRFDGKTWGIPLGAQAAVLYGNRDLFRTRGFAMPDGFDALIAAVDAFRRAGVLPIALGYRERWPAALFFETLAAVRAGGGEAVRERVLSGRFDDPSFLAAARDVRRLVDAGAFRTDASELSMFAEGLSQFRDGRAAMMYHGSWLAAALEDGQSRVRGRVEASAFPGAATAAAPGAATAAAPGAAAGSVMLWGGAFSCLCVNGRTAHPADAAALAKNLSARRDEPAWASGDSLPSHRSTLGKDPVKTGLPAGIAALLPASGGFAPNWDLLLEEKAEGRYLDAVAALFRGGLTPEGFLAALSR